MTTSTKSKSQSQSQSKSKSKSQSKSQSPVLNGTQRRQLLSWRGRPAQELTMGDIKDATGIGRENKYNQPWLINLHALRDSLGLIQILIQERDRKYYFQLTEEGRKVLAQLIRETKGN